jgi:hypothetical protein
MYRPGFKLIFSVFLLALRMGAQDAPAGAPPKQPLDHILGTVTAVDASAHSIIVKEDKVGVDHTILLVDTKTLLKVEPTAKDLKSATRITSSDLEVGDRVDIRGTKSENPPGSLAARSVVLMSARDLQQAHQNQAAAWQHSTAGVVSSVDPASGKLTVLTRTPSGSQPLAVETSRNTEFTRYSLDNPKMPAHSELAQIQAGDQVRVIGDKSADGATIAAQRVYSGAFRTLSATITTLAPDGKSITVKDLATKKPVELSLNEESAVRKLPPMMAMMLARRFNPNFKPAGGGPNGAAPNTGPSPQSPRPEPAAQPGPGERPEGHGGDVSQMLERVPKISVSDLKPGDAIVISGIALAPENTRLLATSIIAGVEPILQSAPSRQSTQNLGGDWGLGDIAVPQ